MELADRKSLFEILSFLDGKLPLYSSIYSLVKFALVPSDDPTYQYRIYFKRNDLSLSCLGEDDFTIIIGTELHILNEAICNHEKLWKIVGWALQDQTMSEAVGALEGINWDEDQVLLVGKNHQPYPNVLQFLLSKQRPDSGKKLQSSPVNQCYLTMNQALNLQLSLPADVYVKSLEPCHTQIVYEHWPYRKTTSIKILAIEVDRFPTAGVFLKTTNELVSWAMYFPTNGMSRLHTLETHRRKGYGSLVIRYLSKRVAQSGYLPTGNINVGNEASLNLFKGIGFQILQPWHLNEFNIYDKE